MKTKIDYEGQPCRKCGFPVKLYTRNKEKKTKQKRKYYYSQFLKCNDCNTFYFNPKYQVFI